MQYAYVYVDCTVYIYIYMPEYSMVNTARLLSLMCSTHLSAGTNPLALAKDCLQHYKNLANPKDPSAVYDPSCFSRLFVKCSR